MRIVEIEKLQLVGLPVRANWHELWSKMPNAWRELFERATEINHRKHDDFVDASLDVKNSLYFQLIGAEVLEVNRAPDGMIAVEVQTQPYVHHRHHGPATGIADAFGDIYRWAKANGHNTSEFKLDRGYTPNGEELFHDLYVALHPAKQWRML